MRATTLAAIAALGIASAAAPEFPGTLLTVPQRDRHRSRASPPSVSVTADGRYIAFASYARLTPDDTDDLSDIYVLDRANAAVSLQSRAVDGVPLMGDCTLPRISGDGRVLVFQAFMTDERSPTADIVLLDRTTDIARWVSRGATGARSDGWSGSAVISDDGSTIAFESSATNLVPGLDANGSLADIYLFHIPTAVTRRIVPDDTETLPVGAASFGPSVSRDGRYIAFISSAPPPGSLLPNRGDRAPPALRRISHVYFHDAKLNQTRRIQNGAAPPNGRSLTPVISRDGLYVAFASEATNLTRGDQNRSTDVFLYETTTGSVTLISRGANRRPANGPSGTPAISADGRFVAFQSDASDIVCASRCPPESEDINLLSDVFLFDRTTGALRWISTEPSGAWMEESVAPAIDASGRIVAFTSRHPIDERDVANDFDLFVHVSSLIR